MAELRTSYEAELHEARAAIDRAAALADNWQGYPETRSAGNELHSALALSGPAGTPEPRERTKWTVRSLETGLDLIRPVKMSRAQEVADSYESEGHKVKLVLVKPAADESPAQPEPEGNEA